MKQSGSLGQSPPDAHGIIAGSTISHPHASPSFSIAFNHSTKMNILKYHFRKKYLHNRNQGWINLALLLMAATVVCCYKPAYRWLTETIENNILLSLTLCALLFLKFLLSRMYYISCIQEGDCKARGCAGSSCLLTIVMAACIIILSIKACREHSKPTPQEQAVRELACSPSDKSTGKNP